MGLKFANGGQICVAPNRVLVERAVYERFLELAAAKAKAYITGAGDDEAANPACLQPVVSAASLDRLVGASGGGTQTFAASLTADPTAALVQDAKAQGARVVAGGGRVDKPGFFLEPTILADVTKGMKLSACEIFGPILPVAPFDTADAAFAAANDSEHGLAACAPLPLAQRPSPDSPPPTRTARRRVHPVPGAGAAG